MEKQLEKQVQEALYIANTIEDQIDKGRYATAQYIMNELNVQDQAVFYSQMAIQFAKDHNLETKDLTQKILDQYISNAGNYIPNK